MPCVSTIANLSLMASLVTQPDFKGQNLRIRKTVQDAGHMVMIYHKLHSELNWIE
jgi:hypothetical protein